MATATVEIVDGVNEVSIKAALETLAPAATDKFGAYTMGDQLVIFKVTTS